MHVYEEMKAYVGFTDEDVCVLREFWPQAEAHVISIIDHFYERIQATPAAAAVLQNEAQVIRLKGTLCRWLEELLRGPHDHAYFERRERIGRVHVDVGLPPRFMFTAMCVMRDDLCSVADSQLDAATARRVCKAVQRITELDLAIMTGTYIDTREERQLKLLRELIVSHLPVTVLLIDRALRVSAATRPASRLFTGAEVVGQPIAAALPPQLVAAADLHALVERAIRTRREITLLRVDASFDGLTRSFRLTLVPLDREDAGALLHIEELTEAIESEARMRRAESLAQLGALSAAVAHELRNPLAGISGAVQVIAKSMGEDDSRRGVMLKVEEQIQRLNALVTDLLSFARPSRVQIHQVALRPVCESVIDLIHKQFPEVRFEIEGAGVAATDPDVLHQIVLNLVQNAAQAVDGQGLVLVHIEGAALCVADSGPGVEAALRERIFEPFYTTRTRGTGLGLAICRKFAQEVRGRLVIRDESPLAGACFHLVLAEPNP